MNSNEVERSDRDKIRRTKRKGGRSLIVHVAEYRKLLPLMLRLGPNVFRAVSATRNSSVLQNARLRGNSFVDWCQERDLGRVILVEWRIAIPLLCWPCPLPGSRVCCKRPDHWRFPFRDDLRIIARDRLWQSLTAFSALWFVGAVPAMVDWLRFLLYFSAFCRVVMFFLEGPIASWSLPSFPTRAP